MEPRSQGVKRFECPHCHSNSATTTFRNELSWYPWWSVIESVISIFWYWSKGGRCSDCGEKLPEVLLKGLEESSTTNVIGLRERSNRPVTSNAPPDWATGAVSETQKGAEPSDEAQRARNWRLVDDTVDRQR